MDGKIFKVNDAFCSMLGYSKEELMSMTIAQITHPDDIPDSLEQIKKLIQGNIERDAFTIEKRYVKKDGSVMWGRINVALARDEQKKPLEGKARRTYETLCKNLSKCIKKGWTINSYEQRHRYDKEDETYES